MQSATKRGVHQYGALWEEALQALFVKFGRENEPSCGDVLGHEAIPGSCA